TEDLKAVPGARSVTAAMIGTLAGNDMGSSVILEGADKTADAHHSPMNYIGPDYFVTLGIPLLEGRAITWADDASAPKVCVVNETFARKIFPGKRAIGQRFGIGGADAKPDTEIVGVVRDSKNSHI